METDAPKLSARAADLRAVARKAGALLPAFFIATIGTVAGTLCAIGLLRDPLLAAFGADGLKVACALAAKNIGGGLNFVAVAAALRLSPVPMATALAVDNVMALVYFPLVSWLGRNEVDPIARDASFTAPPAPVAGQTASNDGGGSVGTAEQSACLAIALSVVAFSRRVASAGYDVPLSTLLTVALATLAPRLVGPLASAGDEMGTLVLCKRRGARTHVTS